MAKTSHIAEVRVDCIDGRPYTLEGLHQKYRHEPARVAALDSFLPWPSYSEEDVAEWWRQCEPVTTLSSEVVPFCLAWPTHWAQAKVQSVAASRSPACSTDDVERHCGPQADFWGSDVMRTIPADALLEALQAARRRPSEVMAEIPRARLRVLNIPGARGERRRRHIERGCLRPLRRCYPGLDADFAEGVVAKDLDWAEASDSSNVHTTTFNGCLYKADTSIWHPPSADEREVMAGKALAQGFIPQLLHAFLKGEDEETTWGYTGCQIAHVEAWRDASLADVDWLMVCEDDVLPNPVFGMDWPDVWGIVAREVGLLRSRGIAWDLLYVGKGSATSSEGEFLTPLTVEGGYNLKMHCYCLSRSGLAKMLEADVSYVSLRPQDEILAALSLGGRHPRPCIAERIERGFPGVANFRSLSFPFWGIVFQLQHFEHVRGSELARSAIAEQGLAAASAANA